MITAPDVLADAPLWLEWWWTTPAGTPEQLRVNLDVLVPSLEKLIMPGLLGRNGPVALASRDGRLIAATSAGLPPDLRVPAGSPALPSPLLHWRLAQLPATPTRAAPDGCAGAPG